MGANNVAKQPILMNLPIRGGGQSEVSPPKFLMGSGHVANLHAESQVLH